MFRVEIIISGSTDWRHISVGRARVRYGFVLGFHHRQWIFFRLRSFAMRMIGRHIFNSGWHNCNQNLNVLHASVVHASGSRQLQANSHVAGPWLSPGKPTRRAVTTMGSNDLVVGVDYMSGPSCQRYNWQMSRCGSIAFGSSPRRGKTLISNPRCLAEVSTRGKDFRR